MWSTRSRVPRRRPTSRRRASASAAPVQAFDVEGESTRSTSRRRATSSRRPEPKVAAASTSSQRMAPPAVTPDPGSAQAYAAERSPRGWASSEFDCLVALWAGESGWRVNATTPPARLRHPAGAARFEDGHAVPIGDERRHPDRMGPRLRAGPLRHALRRWAPGRRLAEPLVAHEWRRCSPGFPRASGSMARRADAAPPPRLDHGTFEPISGGRGPCSR